MLWSCILIGLALFTAVWLLLALAALQRSHRFPGTAMAEVQEGERLPRWSGCAAGT